MPDIIKLLPDSIANQIAAGEVIQRPASVVKELLENAIDAGATTIKLILKEAGRTLIQVIDNGSGMSETDARMSFERHATSKIRDAKDLFAIRTMGFRGEALASIAAIAQVELITCQHGKELGIKIEIEGSILKNQQACQAAPGTQFAVKNLFYNVPARRNFLKSNTVEMRHILDEFERVAIANPEVSMYLHHNGTEIYHLQGGNIRQRIVSVLGKESNKNLVPLDQSTDVVKMHGFVGKPEASKKQKGEQFFFVNNRFIKSAYLHHAVMSAYEDLIPKENYPLYFIFMEIDPSKIDINVHPTKTEIKFDDERIIYNYLRVAVRHGLGQHSIIPMLDFDQEPGLNMHYNNTFSTSQKEYNPTTEVPNIVIPAGVKAKLSDHDWKMPPKSIREESNLKNWEVLYNDLDDLKPNNKDNENEVETFGSKMNKNETEPETPTIGHEFVKHTREPYQLHNSYILNHIKSGYILIDQQYAHERILFEKYLKTVANKKIQIQKILFPKVIQLNASDTEILRSIMPEVKEFGLDLEEFGNNAFIVHGKPAEWELNIDEEQVILQLIAQCKENMELNSNLMDNVAKSLCRSTAIKKGVKLSIIEMQTIIEELFACEMPYKSPFGKQCFISYDLEDISKKF
jgi:DNA mismatch repair protein MutL